MDKTNPPEAGTVVTLGGDGEVALNEGRWGLLGHVFFLDPHSDYLGVLLLFKFTRSKYILHAPSCMCVIFPEF